MRKPRLSLAILRMDKAIEKAEDKRIRAMWHQEYLAQMCSLIEPMWDFEPVASLLTKE